MIAEYITKEELQQHLVLSDEELNEQYQQLRIANNAFYVRECKVTFRIPFNWKHPFRKRKETVIQYEVLEDLGGQARVCSFPTAKGDEWSFRTMIGELDLKTFIYGYLNGTSITLKKLEEYHPKPKFATGDAVKVVDADTMRRLSEKHGLVIGSSIVDLCGRTFAVSDIRYSYVSDEHTYQFESHPNSAWIRERFLEPYKEENHP